MLTDPDEPASRPDDRPIRPGQPPSGSDAPVVKAPAEYWRRNLKYLAVLLMIWFTVSYGAGILLVEPLNALRIPGTGFPLGFWFAQQGSIYIFVILIFVYVVLMNRLDREFDVDEEDAGRLRRVRRQGTGADAEPAP